MCVVQPELHFIYFSERFIGVKRTIVKTILNITKWRFKQWFHQYQQLSILVCFISQLIFIIFRKWGVKNSRSSGYVILQKTWFYHLYAFKRNVHRWILYSYWFVTRDCLLNRGQLGWHFFDLFTQWINTDSRTSSFRIDFSQMPESYYKVMDYLPCCYGTNNADYTILNYFIPLLDFQLIWWILHRYVIKFHLEANIYIILHFSIFKLHLILWQIAQRILTRSKYNMTKHFFKGISFLLYFLMRPFKHKHLKALELTTPVVISIDYTDSCKSNYHTIKTTSVPNNLRKMGKAKFDPHAFTYIHIFFWGEGEGGQFCMVNLVFLSQWHTTDHQFRDGSWIYN
jgi:hypothetical protein